MRITRLFIDRELMESPEALDVQRRIGLVPQVVDSSRDVFEEIAAEDDPIEKGKHVLHLTRNRGAFVRECPGTRHYTCCSYRVLHVASYCWMDCAYCILQTYFHPPVLQYFVNVEDLAGELDGLFALSRLSRIGTGEFTDSLIWERWTGLVPMLVQQFSRQNRAVLELKTKTADVKKLIDLDHQEKTIVSWSLNTERVIREQERHTASLTARLQAARRCADRGYPLAFHLDPILIYTGCGGEYRRMVERLFSEIPADRIVWISLGAFRFMPDLKGIIQRRFPTSNIIYGEFVQGLDGKMRYFKPLRIDLYRRIVEWIRSCAPETTLYLCMEDDEVWERSLGFVPTERGGLSNLLDTAASRHCGLDAALLS